MISHSSSSPFDMFSSLKLVGWLSGLERSLWWISGKVFTGRLYINTHTFTPCISGFFWSIIVITWSSLAFSVGWFGWFCILVHTHILTLTYKLLGIRKISCQFGLAYKPSFNYIYLSIQIHVVVLSVAAFGCQKECENTNICTYSLPYL